MKTEQQKVDLNEALHELFQSRQYTIELLREGLFDLYKGWVCSVAIDETTPEDRQETTWRYHVIDEILKTLKPAEPQLFERKKAA